MVGTVIALMKRDLVFCRHLENEDSSLCEIYRVNGKDAFVC